MFEEPQPGQLKPARDILHIKTPPGVTAPNPVLHRSEQQQGATCRPCRHVEAPALKKEKFSDKTAAGSRLNDATDVMGANKMCPGGCDVPNVNGSALSCDKVVCLSQIFYKQSPNFYAKLEVTGGLSLIIC